MFYHYHKWRIDLLCTLFIQPTNNDSISNNWFTPLKLITTFDQAYRLAYSAKIEMMQKQHYGDYRWSSNIKATFTFMCLQLKSLRTFCSFEPYSGFRFVFCLQSKWQFSVLVCDQHLSYGKSAVRASMTLPFSLRTITICYNDRVIES